MNKASNKTASAVSSFTHRFFYLLVMLLVSIGHVTTAHGYEQAVDKVLAGSETPIGVVFEVVSSDQNFLEKALPEVSRLTKKIRQRFPGLDVVMVTHGREMFSLTKSSQQNNPQLKRRFDSLLADDVTVHVCGTYAAWQDVDPSEFPDTINVSAEGPAQIEDYVSLGYTLIKISRIE